MIPIERDRFYGFSGNRGHIVGGRSTLITSQLPLDHWYDYIGDPTLADTILDRLIHNAHKIYLKVEESMREGAGAIEQKSASKTKKVD